MVLLLCSSLLRLVSSESGVILTSKESGERGCRGRGTAAGGGGDAGAGDSAAAALSFSLMNAGRW